MENHVINIFQDENGNYIAVCYDSAAWITRSIKLDGSVVWTQISPPGIPV